jgi:hypothetical protein
MVLMVGKVEAHPPLRQMRPFWKLRAPSEPGPGVELANRGALTSLPTGRSLDRDIPELGTTEAAAGFVPTGD